MKTQLGELDIGQGIKRFGNVKWKKQKFFK